MNNKDLNANTVEKVGEGQNTEKSLSDSHTLEVRGGDPGDPDPRKRPTDPRGLSRSVLHVLADPRGGGYVNVKSVGPKALAIVMTAYRMAAEESEKATKGTVLVLRQSEYRAEVGGKFTQGICTRIFPIETRHAI